MASQIQLAEHLFLTTRRIRDLQKLSGFPASKGRDGYDLDLCRRWYFDYLKKQAQKSGTVSDESKLDDLDAGVVGGINVPFEEARKKKIDADTRHYKLHILKGDFMPVDLLLECIQQVAAKLSAQLTTFKPDIKMAMPELSGKALLVIDKKIAELSSELANAQPDLSEYVAEYPAYDTESTLAAED